jgi:hypothetical protein
LCASEGQSGDRLFAAGELVLSQKIQRLVVVLLAFSTAALGKDVALISNRGNTMPVMSLADVVKVCKGQMSHWPDGKPVTLIMRSPGSADLKLVEEKVYGGTSDEVRELVTSANHSRADRPAIIVANSDEDVIHKVESMPGAVGLVDVYSITGAVKVVKIGGKLPLEAGYPLHGN